MIGDTSGGKAPTMHENDELPTLTTGQKIKVLRQRAGMPRKVLAGMVGKSSDWVKSVETGRIMTPRLTVRLVVSAH
ncbi:helix-turn-helix domain-containing protein [Couchioplanes azureus]|uniref:helix-turn-helix domain-containing protein n=1 Tax=Couchioplanes caeruleus TaxID=56438 RepID=UPI0019B50E2F|nr:helix-turn-helix transcriptional regulator [Couchioplanes caeruleus]GGQ83467.1 hypothetical protein GCM10010166_62010 [Couchioplanes caeruleus subsp. azureus]